MLKKYQRPIRFIIYLFLICSGLVVLLSTVTQPQTTTPLAALEPPPSAPALSLVVDVPPMATALGAETTLAVAVTNNAPTPLTDVRLQLPYHSDIIYKNSAYIAASEITHDTLYLGNLDAGATITLSLPIQVRGVSERDAVTLNFKAMAVESDSVITEAVLPVEPAAAAAVTLSTNESLVSAPDSPLVFNLSVAHENQHLAYALLSERRLLSQESGTLFAFRLDTTSATLTQTLTNDPILVTLALTDLAEVAELSESQLWLYTRPTVTDEWQKTGVIFDKEAGTVQFAATGVGQFQLLQTSDDPQPWELTYSPPGASAFTGSAQYSHSIALPPGIGGLAPDLTLHYNSRGVDSMTAPVMNSGLGAGWSISQIEVVNGNTTKLYSETPGFDNYKFTLNINGQTYRLRPYPGVTRHGQYTAIGGADMYIEYVANTGAPNTTGEYWLVRTANGIVYRLGYTGNAEQVVAPIHEAGNSDQPRNPNFSAASWKVDLISDKYDRQITYSYNTRRTELGVDGYREVDVAVNTIAYNFVDDLPQTTIEFGYSHWNNHLLDKQEYMLVGHYRPQEMTITHNNVVVNRVKLEYVGQHHNTGLGIVEFWWPIKIESYGPRTDSNLILPATRFLYEQDANGCSLNQAGEYHCVPLLTQVDNGYGAVTKLVYAQRNQYDKKWFHVQDIYTWDGVDYPYTGDGSPAASRTHYSRAGMTDCYDVDGSGCRTPHSDASQALVGFSGVTLEVQEQVAGTWQAVSRQVQTFRIDNYWLNGRVQTSQQYDPASGDLLQESSQQWQLHNGTEARLEEETSTRHDLVLGQQLTTTVTYNYHNNYGAVYEKLEYDADESLYRCTQYIYGHEVNSTTWLVNRPLRETTYEGNCGSGKVAETLYRYGDSSTPLDIGLYGQAEPRWILHLADIDLGHYVTQRLDYYQSGVNAGLLEKTTSFADYSTPLAYAATERHYERIAAYSSLGLPTTTETGGSGITPRGQTITYDSQYPWLPAVTTDANNVSTRYGYDDFGRLLKIARPGDDLNNPTVAYTYWDDPAIPNAGGTVFLSPLLIETSYKDTLQENVRQFYNGLGQVVQTQHRRSQLSQLNGTTPRDVLVTYAYDARGQQVCQTVPYDIAPYNPATDWPNSPYREDNCFAQTHTTTSYDALGRLSQVTAPDETVTTHRYGIADGHSYHDIVNPERQQVQYRYDPFGQLAYVYEIEGNCSVWDNLYPCAGEYMEQWQIYARTDYAYDLMGNLKFVNAYAGDGVTLLRQTAMGYDALGRKTGMSDPDMGDWHYTYYPDGNLETQTDAKEQTIHFVYDALGRLQTKSHNGTTLASYTYDDEDVDYSSGRLTHMSDEAGWQSWTYDERGRVTSETRAIDGVDDWTMNYSYDNLDRPVSMTYPDGEVVTTLYNNQGTPRRLTGTNLYVSAATYNVNGQMVQLNLGNGRTTSYSYDPDTFRLTGLVTDGALQTLNYEYDKVGNITQIDDILAGDRQTFGYDSLNRLKTAVANPIGSGECSIEPCYNHSYDYDELGNIKDYAGSNYQYDEVAWHVACYDNPEDEPEQSLPHAVRHIDSHYFCYDHNGNMTSRNHSTGNYSQEFDVENRLVRVIDNDNGEETHFGYDANGQRLYTQKPDGTLIYTPFPGYEETIGYFPTLNLFAEGAPSQNIVYINPNHSFTIEWETQYVSQCSASGDWSGLYPASGMITQPGFSSGSREFIMTCENEFGSVQDSVTIMLIQVAMDFTVFANPSSALQEIEPFYYEIQEGIPYMLEWGSIGQFEPEACEASGNWSGMKMVPSGAQSFPGLTHPDTKIYSLRCWHQTTEVFYTINLNSIPDQSPPMIDTFKANDETYLTIPPHTTFTLDWNTSNTDTCTASGSWSGSKDLNGSQSIRGFSSGWRTYSLTCSNSNGTTSQSVTVEIGYIIDPPITEMSVEGSDILTKGDVVIQRSTYMLAGQAIAVRVNGDPISGNNGLFYIHSDHLGSTSVMSNAAGQKVNESEARYLPFGDWRVEPGHDLTDRGFTGQKHNMDLGLYYYNARFYLPGIGRFASADPIVPDPSNPQQFNRYTYVLNNPIALVDPTGHFSEGAIWGHIYSDVCASDMACVYNTLTSWQQDGEWWEMLLAAEAGDVIFVDGGRHFAFLGEGKELLNGIVFSTYNGEYNHSLYAPNEFFDMSLQDLFTGNGGVWGGWYHIQDNGVIGIHHRASVTTIYPQFEPDTLGRAIRHGAAGGAIGATSCLPVGSAAGAVICGTIASTATGAASALLPEFYELQGGEDLVVSAGHGFVYRSHIQRKLDGSGQIGPTIAADHIRIYGPYVYKQLQGLRVNYRYD